ncbi:MAG: class I SAM-dependent methyltransferase [Synechococcus sp.]|nr:class I SAM-dependent methyltransferase [Synechococcus sp.]
MNGKENLIISKDSIIINDFDSSSTVMHISEKDISIETGNLTCANGGDILEIGFGMHLTADAIQNNTKIKSHTIIEVHPQIHRMALEWAKNKKNTNIILGDWVDVLPKLGKKFDGILHDTHLDDNIPNFLNNCKHLCNKGCIVVFWYYEGSEQHLFNIKKVSLEDDDIFNLPYKDFADFKDWKLYHTFFNGEDFVKEL